MFEHTSDVQLRNGVTVWLIRGYFALALVAFAVAVSIPDWSGPDAMCHWLPDTTGALNVNDETGALHLTRDAEKAEDLAIRYADGHNRPGTAINATTEDYLRTRDQCTAVLFQAVADQHHVTPQEVRASVNTHRSKAFDLATMLSFALLYALAADRLVRAIWQRSLSPEDRLTGIVATVVISSFASFFGVMIGDLWTGAAEVLRIGYGHLVQRAARIPWGHHRVAVFVAGVMIFWILSGLHYREVRRRVTHN